jgi:hypothetical protein
MKDSAVVILRRLPNHPNLMCVHMNHCKRLDIIRLVLKGLEAVFF